MNKKILTILFLFLCSIATIFAQIPPQPNPPRLVNDLANLFSQTEVLELERKLVDFNDSTSNVVCVVTVNDLNGYSAAEFAYEIGENWGVRDKKYRNGVVILVKPKNETSGEVYISVGYDLEGVLPDATSKQIIEQFMIPSFKQNDYYGGVNKAVEVMLPILSGEISAIREPSQTGVIVGAIFGILFIVFMVFLVIILSKKGGGGSSGNGSSGKGNDVWKWILLGSLLSGKGGGRSSGGGFGSSGGGFGGFGGSGGFGGGGAGGKW